MYKLLKVDENTWAFEDQMPDGDTVRFFVLDGDERCLVIDSGYLEMDIQGLVRKLLQTEGRDKNQAGGEKQILLANTHGDVDHTGGNGSFPSFYLTLTDYECCHIKQKCPDAELIPVQEGMRIELGGRTMEYILAPGHTYGNAVLLDVSNRVLYPGDMIQTGSMFMFGAHRCPEKMASSLTKLRERKADYDQIYACHGQIVLPADAVDQVIEAWNMVLNKSVIPVPKIVLDTEIDMYCCGFCNFYCNQEPSAREA